MDKSGLVRPSHPSSSSAEPDPQSGKTFFLIWLLMQRLALKLPTALQLRDSYAIFFHAGGTFRFLDVANTEAYMDLQSSNYSDRIWALVDSSQVLFEPAPIFRTGNPFFVIEAASRESRFEWASRVHRQYFYMGTWAFSEVLQAYVTPPLEVHNTHGSCSRPFMGLSYGGPHEESQLRHLYDVYRAPPRALARYARIPDEYGDLVAQKVQQITPGDLRSVFHNPDPDDSSHLIVRIEPSPTKRTRFEKTFASRRVFELLCDRHLRDSVADMKHFYYVSQDSSVTAPAAGWIFELRMHQLFRQGYLLKILPLGRGEAKNKEFDDVYDNYATFHKEEGPKYFDLAVSQEHRLDEGSQLQVDRYYRPKADSFPTIDSLLLVHPTGEQSPILLMFQITCGKGCGVKEVSLEKIERLKFPLDTRKYYVAVTPASIVPEITVPKGRFADVGVFRHPVKENKLFLPA